MSHEMAALLLTITIQSSLLSLKTIFVLLLDAKSAFDLVLRQILIRRLYLDSPKDQRVIYWDKRLDNRTTYCQWEDQLMGPISDELGVEQGGPNSSEFAKFTTMSSSPQLKIQALGQQWEISPLLPSARPMTRLLSPTTSPPCSNSSTSLYPTVRIIKLSYLQSKPNFSVTPLVTLTMSSMPR